MSELLPWRETHFIIKGKGFIKQLPVDPENLRPSIASETEDEPIDDNYLISPTMNSVLIKWYYRDVRCAHFLTL